MENEEFPKIRRAETCSVASVRRIAAMLDQDPDAMAAAGILPRGWHFILLAADTRRSSLREDGFPGLGVPMPQLGLPRLVLAGRNVSFHADIPIGAAVERESRILRLTRKESSTGPIAVLTVAHELRTEPDRVLVVAETQTYILSGPRRRPEVKREPSPTVVPEFRKTLVPDDTLLFQYSALGFNSHRIHLDRDYARHVEGYPDLVVNGGLTTLIMTEFLRKELGVVPLDLAVKHVAPLFAGRPLTVGADRTSEGWRLIVLDDAGLPAAEMEVNVR